MLTSFSAIRDSSTRLTLQQLSRRLDDVHGERTNCNLGNDVLCASVVWLTFSPVHSRRERVGEVAFLRTPCRKPLTSILSPHGRAEADSCKPDIMSHALALTAD